NVKESRRMLLRELLRSRAARHRRGDGDELRIDRAELREPASEHLRVVRAAARRIPLLARRRIMSRGQRVPLLEARPGGKTLAFLRDDVDEARTLERLHRLERLEQERDVMSVDRPEIPE